MVLSEIAFVKSFTLFSPSNKSSTLKLILNHQILCTITKTQIHFQHISVKQLVLLELSNHLFSINYVENKECHLKKYLSIESEAGNVLNRSI